MKKRLRRWASVREIAAEEGGEVEGDFLRISQYLDELSEKDREEFLKSWEHFPKGRGCLKFLKEWLKKHLPQKQDDS